MYEIAYLKQASDGQTSTSSDSEFHDEGTKVAKLKRDSN